MRQSWRFALPPSVGDSPVRAAQVRTALSPIGCGSVRMVPTYEHLVNSLEMGSVDAAWAPPLVCARIEAQGSRVLLRAVRGGGASYRAALFGRADRKLTLDNLGGTSVAWLDEQSMSGYVLPRGLLRRHGLDPDQLFARQKFLGSHAACVQAVLDGMVDVASTYASPETAKDDRLGYVPLAGDRANELTVIAHTAESPNDGIILSSAITEEEAQEFADAFERLRRDTGPARALARALEVDEFDVPRPGSYLVLSSELVSALTA